MKKFFLKIAYDGSQYRGWQLQAPDQENIRASISKELCSAIEKCTATTEFTLHGSGRTDVGVHARGQTAHLKITTRLDAATLERAINSYLPRDIRVYSVQLAEENFHAQFGVKRKCYRYFLLCKTEPQKPDWPFFRDWVWHIPQELKIEEMRQALQSIVGVHNFAAFRNLGTPVKDTVREIFSAEVIEHRGEASQNLLSNSLPWMPPEEFKMSLVELRFVGKGFLKQMVRNIVGTLVEIGKGNMGAQGMQEILESKDRSKAGATAPSQGLFLDNVFYSEE